MLVLTVAYFSITENDFWSNTNIQNVLTSSSVVWIIAMGMTLVLISAGLDLSVAATASLAGLCLVKLLHAGVPGWLAIVLTVLLGATLGGLTNGFLIGRLKLSVFLVTLATLTSFTGIVSIWSGTQSTYLYASIVNQVSINTYLGVSASIWVMAIVFVVVFYLQSRTYFGRDVFAIGGSLQAAQLSGIRPARTIVGVYALVGGCSALAGIIAAGRTGAVVPQVDNTLPLQAIAAVLLGGTSLTGGSGGVGGTAIGVLFLGTLQNGLSLNGVSSFWQQVVTGVILVAAVLLARLERPEFSLKRLRGRPSPPPGEGDTDDTPTHEAPAPEHELNGARPASSEVQT
jgi:ribose transport system permease protein